MTQADRARHKRIREIVNSSQGYERRVASQMIEKINITSDGHWLWSGTVQQPSGLPALNLWNDERRMVGIMPGRWVLKNLCGGDFGLAFQVVSICGERTCVCPSHLVVTTLGGRAKQRVRVFSDE